jgi:hypothetical protein
MGNEFLRKQRESRAKGWNRQLRAGDQDMLTSLAPGQELGCRATVSGEMPRVGSKLMLQLLQGEIKVRDQNACIGEVSNPKEELLRGLERGAGLMVAEVRSQLPSAGCIDLVVER